MNCDGEDLLENSTGKKETCETEKGQNYGELLDEKFTRVLYNVLSTFTNIWKVQSFFFNENCMLMLEKDVIILISGSQCVSPEEKN